MHMTPRHVGLVAADLVRTTAFYEAHGALADPGGVEFEIKQEA